MTILDTPIRSLAGQPLSLRAVPARALLVVNVASQCGLTPQYEGLEELQRRYGPRGLSVVGFPCNQFGAQEPGSPEEIATFCSTTYGVTFPLFEKIEVNGDGRHPIYQVLVEAPDTEGYTGDIRWNFEKFLVVDDAVAARFAPTVTPEDPRLVEAVEAVLA
ncbi:MAG: glutathione peroxidase [Acidimicrobiales bacterium]